MIPAAEFWFSPAALAGLTTLLALTAVGAYQRNRAWGILFALAAIVAWYSLAATEARTAKPERDIVYFFVQPSEPIPSNGQVRLFWRSTGILDGTKVCFTRTVNYPGEKAEVCWPPFDFEEDARPCCFIEPAHWVIDIDPKTRLGKVRQWLDIVRNNGRAVVLSSRVIRKATGEILRNSPETKC